jgi:hypothetical protein
MNPNNFIAGSLHNHFVEWEKLSPDKQILEWVKNGVDVHQFLKHFNQLQITEVDTQPSTHVKKSLGLQSPLGQRLKSI